MTVNTDLLRVEIEALASAAKENKVFTEFSFCTGFLDDKNGQFDFESKPGELGRVFDLSSMTKALVTTSLTLNRVFNLKKTENATLDEIFTEEAFFKLEPAKKLKLVDVLRHEAGLPFWKNFFVETQSLGKRDKKTVLLEALQEINASKKNLYSDIGMILLGELLERSDKRSLSDVWKIFCSERIEEPFENLPKPSTFYDPKDCVTTGFCKIRNRILLGEVHDENAWALGGFPGHSGLFGSVKQVKTFLKALYASPVGKKTIEKNFEWAQKDKKSDSALGWRTARDEASLPFGLGDAVGHWGFTGTAFWVNPANKSFAILLTNRVACERIKNLSQIKIFRKNMFSILQRHIDSAIKNAIPS